jgi:hypothetical protein
VARAARDNAESAYSLTPWAEEMEQQMLLQSGVSN